MKKILGFVLSVAFIAMATHYRIEDGAAPGALVLLSLVSMFYLLFEISHLYLRKRR